MLPLFSMTPPGLRRPATSLDVWAAFLLLLVGTGAAGAQDADLAGEQRPSRHFAICRVGELATTSGNSTSS